MPFANMSVMVTDCSLIDSSLATNARPLRGDLEHVTAESTIQAERRCGQHSTLGRVGNRVGGPGLLQAAVQKWLPAAPTREILDVRAPTPPVMGVSGAC